MFFREFVFITPIMQIYKILLLHIQVIDRILTDFHLVGY